MPLALSYNVEIPSIYALQIASQFNLFSQTINIQWFMMYINIFALNSNVKGLINYIYIVYVKLSWICTREVNEIRPLIYQYYRVCNSCHLKEFHTIYRFQSINGDFQNFVDKFYIFDLCMSYLYHLPIFE